MSSPARKRRAKRRNTPLAGIAPQVARRQRLRRVFIVEDLATVGQQFADGTTDIEFKVGNYTYKWFSLMIETAAAVQVDFGAGNVTVTFEADGKHFVKTEYLSHYIDDVKIEIDGERIREWTVDEKVKLTGFNNYDVSDGLVYFTFGGPDLIDDDDIADAYRLGTLGVRDLRMKIEMTENWDNGNMFIRPDSEFTLTPRRPDFLVTNQRRKYHSQAVGEMEIVDLPVSSDLAAIWVQGENITHAELVIDGVTLFKGYNYRLASINDLYGKDSAALGAGVYFDFWRDGDAQKGIRSLEADGQIRRNAKIELFLEMAAADEEITVQMVRCGKLQQQS